MAKHFALDYTPQPRQKLLHDCNARQIFYGGAAGGGKSKALREDAIYLCLENPGLQAYIFRRTYDELVDNHIKFLKTDIPPELGTWNETRKQMEFSNAATLHCCFAERDQDIKRYQGAEMHVASVDEAGLMTPFQLNFIRTRNRLGGFTPNPKFAHALPRMVLASNPGGPAHSFLKRTFIDAAPPETLFYDREMRDPDNPDDPGWSSIFIPAKIADNKYIDANYKASFGGLPPEYARALREGDWDAVVGQALHTLTRGKHQLRPFKPPRHWTRFMSIDWGTASPFSVGWLTVSDGAILPAQENWPERYLPSGAVILYAEWYGWNGRENQGCRMDSVAVAKGIIEREKARDEVMDYRIADSHMWAKTDGPSVAERMMGGDDTPRMSLRKSEKDRAHNYAEFLARLAGNPRYRDDGTMEEDPMFFATANCTHFWRTVPSLQLDENHPDKGPGDSKSAEDHSYDCVSYALRSRPYVTTEEDRYMEEMGPHIREAMRKGSDPYSTS